MTDDFPRQTVRELIARYGASVCNDRLRCEGLLRDFCPGDSDRRAVNVLLSALKERVALDLSNFSGTFPVGATLSRLSKRLEDQQALTPEMARWAVESWALALGKISEADLTTPREKNVLRAARHYIAAKTSSALPPKKPVYQSAPQPSLAPPPPPDSSQRRQLGIIAGAAAIVILGGILFATLRHPAPDHAIIATPAPTAMPNVFPTAAPTTTSTRQVTQFEPVTPIPTEASTSTPSPSEPNTPTPAPLITEADAQAFVNSFYRAVERHDLDAILSAYSETVDYFTEGQRDHAYIRDDYTKYYKKWPSVAFTPADLRVGGSVTESKVTLTFRTQFSVQNPAAGQSKAGRTLEEWDVSKSYDTIKIMRCRETVYADASASTNPPVSTRTDNDVVRQFVSDYFADLARHDLASAAAKYDDYANYFEYGRRARNFIKTDINRLLSRWTQLRYDIGAIDVSQASDGSYVARFSYTYVVQAREQKSGRSDNVWIMRNAGGVLRIISCQETVYRN